MIDKKTYELLKKEYGHVGSWAVWRPAGDTPRSNTDDMSWAQDEDLLQTLNTGFVFVGLNWSSTHGEKGCSSDSIWKNFHSGYCRQNDYKLRYALQGTRYWGSYITDLIKMYPEVDSGKVHTYLRHHPEVVRNNIETFQKEIALLGKKPVLVAMGRQAFELLDENLSGGYQITMIKHYSYAISKEDYRRELIARLAKY